MYGKDRDEGPSEEYWVTKRNQEIGMSVLKFLGMLMENATKLTSPVEAAGMTFEEKVAKCKKEYDFWFNLLKSGKTTEEGK